VAAASDAECVEKVRAGDTAAFADLYRAHAPAVAVAVRANIRDSEAVADVVQEAFLRALEQLDSLREADRFRPWVLAIARNAAVDERRHHQRVVADLDAAGELTSSEVGPEDLAELRDAVRAVRGCVAGLSRRDATAVALVSELGFGPAEVGAALGISPGAAKVVVHRARRRLQAALELEAAVRERASVDEALDPER
jgi:RNA polymerase sigma factor (sigma-70 family)